MKEHVAQFEVALDVSERAKLYDYASGTWVHSTTAAGDSSGRAIAGAFGSEEGAMSGGGNGKQLRAPGMDPVDPGIGERVTQVQWL